MPERNDPPTDLPKWEDGLHDPDEIKRVHDRAKKHFEKIRNELKAKHPGAKLVMIDADSFDLTVGAPGDDRVEVARKHYSAPNHSPKFACMFRL
jgi:hypothetical protein